MTQFLEQAETANEVGDMVTIRRLFHTIKSSARSLGADELADLASAMEDQAAVGHLPDAAGQIHQLNREFELAKQELVVYVESLSAN